MSKNLSRRSFLKTAVGAGLAATLPRGIIGCGGTSGSAQSRPPPVLFISIDSLPPTYLSLNSRGRTGGKNGDWLIPNIRRFLDDATLFADARCYLPAATDMNHLNAIAGTSSAQTGLNSVSAQPYNWNDDGTIRWEKPNISWVRDDLGRPVDTLFRAWKRKWPESRTTYITGKFWVGEFHHDATSGVDIIVTGGSYPEYLSAPEKRNFYDPPGDADGATDPESLVQKYGCELIPMRDPAHFPSDSWIVDGALEVLSRERPDLGVILLAQLDDAHHALGSVADPDDFEPCRNLLCDYRSKRNQWVYLSPILDVVTDVDRQFGRLIEGLKGIEYYRDATVILYSDHGHNNHLFQEDLGKATDAAEILYSEGLISEDEKNGNGFALMGLSSLGAVYWKADTLEERRERARQAKEALASYAVTNPGTLVSECPWDILAHEDMISGVPGVAEPGELWHKYFGPNNDRQSLVWPDLILCMKNGWQAPLSPDLLANLGIILPFPLPPVTLFLGGHGAPDTQRIVMVMSGPGIPRGKILSDPDYAKNYRIADLAATVASRCDLRLQSTTVGQDRSKELAHSGGG